jgi:transcriptional regulator MraZ
VTFRGTFDHSLDAKNRLTIPSKFRASLSGGVVLAKGLNQCVAIWTPDVFEAYLQRALETLPPLSPQAEAINSFFSANSWDTELDSAGRVMLPKELMEHGALRKEVVVTGAGQRLEVWDRPAWASHNAALREEVLKITANLGHAG